MPPPADSPAEGPGLIEPERPAPTVDLNSLDTVRILRDTGSLHIPDTTDEVGDDSPETQTQDQVSTATTDATPEEDSNRTPVQAGLNILSVISSVLALTLSPFAMIFGYIAVGQIRRAHQRGEALAWISVGFGWLWTIGYVVLGVVLGMTWLQL
jgi:hypothetical protein